MRTRESINGVSPHRGAVAVMVLVTLTVMLGFAALTVDVGAMYNAKADLQRTADAAALAAAGVLGNAGDQDPAAYARTVAAEYAAKNGVMGRTMELDGATDVTLGRAVYDFAANTYTFVPTTSLPDSVKVRARLTADSPNGAMGLFFARLMGHEATEMQAEAVAMMVPRDLAIVADLSGSHTDDSELAHYAMTDINLFGVWDKLPGGIDEVDGGKWDPSQIPADWVEPDGSVPQAAGPAWGYLKKLGYGTMTLNATYNPTTDPGLVKLQYNAGWTDAQLQGHLYQQGYIAAEVNAIMASTHDLDGAYANRVAVALGLAFWNSGIPGGLWERRGVPSGTGNGNDWIADAEVDWTETLLSKTIAESPAIWRQYVDYMKSSSTNMNQANPGFRYRYGVKTLTNFLLERRASHLSTPELSSVPEQPMQAVKDATTHLTAMLHEQGTNDQMSLEIYGTTARHEVDLTPNFTAVSDRLHEMQAAHYDSYTNTGGGIVRAIEELTSSRARPIATKIIILLTDGNANVSASGGAGTSAAYVAAGAAYALSAAQSAADAGIRIFAVSVGADANQSLMQQIADIGSGEHFHAEGSIEQYSAQLEQIFYTIGGRRPVQLIQ